MKFNVVAFLIGLPFGSVAWLGYKAVRHRRLRRREWETAHPYDTD